MYRIEVANIKIEVHRKDIKNIHLGVYPPNGRVRIASPMNVSKETIRLFAISKVSWIKRHQRKFQEQVREAKREYVSRESHYFFGRRYQLKVNFTESKPSIELKHNTIILYVKKETSTERKRKMMTEWYRSELKKVIPLLIDKWQKKIGITADSWEIKQMSTKWGTCNIRDKRIWFNLELAKKPMLCIEYIVVHELLHLMERKHNDLFVGLIEHFMPLWKKHRAELNSLPISHKDWEY